MASLWEKKHKHECELLENRKIDICYEDREYASMYGNWVILTYGPEEVHEEIIKFCPFCGKKLEV